MQTSRTSALSEVAWLDLQGNPEPLRQITLVELGRFAPFPVQRIYWLHDIDVGDLRGHHAHITTQQLFVVLNGRIRIELDDGFGKQAHELHDPTRGLWVPAGLWRVFEFLEPQTVVLVLASTVFDEADYIRDYGAFLAFAGAGRR